MSAPRPVPRPPLPQPAIQTSVDALLDRFAMRKYWRGPRQRLGARESDTVLERDFEGFLVFVYLRTDNPDVTVKVGLYGDGTVDIALSPRLLHDSGLLCPQYGAAACVSKYDDANSDYAAIYAPTPWIPWKGFARITVSNPTLQPARYTLEAWMLERRR